LLCDLRALLCELAFQVLGRSIKTLKDYSAEFAENTRRVRGRAIDTDDDRVWGIRFRGEILWPPRLFV